MPPGAGWSRTMATTHEAFQVGSRDLLWCLGSPKSPPRFTFSFPEFQDKTGEDKCGGRSF